MIGIFSHLNPEKYNVKYFNWCNMYRLQGIEEQQSHSTAVYNASISQLQSTGQSYYRQVKVAKVEPRFFGVDSRTYSEDAKFKFNRDFKEIKARESESSDFAQLHNFSPVIGRAWNNPEIMRYLLETYSQFVHCFCNKTEAANTISRLTEFLLIIDKEMASFEKTDPFELLEKYPKPESNKLLIKACGFCIRNSKDRFCEKNIIFFLGLLPLLIEIENHVDLPDFKFRFPDYFLADFLLSMTSGGERDFFLNKKTIKNYLKTYNERKELFHFFSEPNNQLNLSPLFLILNNYYWSRLYTKDALDTKTVETSKKSELWSFFFNSAAPQYLFKVLFDGFSGHEHSCHDEPAYKSQNSLLNNSLLKTVEFNPDLIRFGEEFEFSFESVSGKKYSPDLLITKWSKHISFIMSSMNIPESEFSITIKNGNQDKELYFTFGDWNCKFYPDYDVFEVNCSPYTIEQVFTCNGATYTAYELFDIFILAPAELFLLKGISGHKHIDIRNSISNNPELLFRFLLSVENERFLVKALDRESQCEQYFPYLSMCNYAPQWKSLLDHTIQLINKELAAGNTTQPMGFYTYAYAFQQLWELKHIYCPAKIRLAPQHASSNSDTRICKPDGTLELRFWHGARTGQEARKINEIILAWMNTLSQKQKNKIPLFLKLDDVEDIDSNRIEMLFDNFCNNIGLQPENYRGLIRFTTVNDNSHDALSHQTSRKSR
ncbi:hypothetical protein [Salinisphaera sp. G21_0]|uniref:hypothetical protein n=1 Tax=Salinisphaera sp. G21_0 TaxID=2821094 RepID=UPI001ADAC1CB|nr:hypothetical protein [Salinisphaera sp. G21_0]MBO9484480.1 hypothetical protein [Salinisphaera sp. G21_0]